MTQRTESPFLLFLLPFEKSIARVMLGLDMEKLVKDIEFYEKYHSKYAQDKLDESRANIGEWIMENVDVSILMKMHGASESEMMEIRRWAFSKAILGLVKCSCLPKNENIAPSLRGIAWSVLIKDVKETLGPHGQREFSSEWKGVMGKLINQTRDIRGIESELQRFINNDPNILISGDGGN